MTNQQNDEFDELILKPEIPHHRRDRDVPSDMTAEDLHLQTETPAQHRDYIDTSSPDTPSVLLEAESHRKSPKKPKNPKKQRTTKQKVLLVLLIIGLTLLGLLIAAATTVTILYFKGRSEMLPDENVVLTVPQSLVDDPSISVTVKDNGRYVTYNNKKYKFNENRTNILCIGKDQTESGVQTDVGLHGQADTLVLLSIDTKTGEIDAIPISRDTVTDVALYREDGSYHGIEKTQICLSYAYSADDVSSCENVVKSVNRLFYGVPINTYFCIDLGAIPLLNDSVGGVTVTALNDFKRVNGTPVKKGTTITLQGLDAERYVRHRNVMLLNSNSLRMERQKQYISAFFETTMAATKKDLNVPLDLLDKVTDNSTTTLNASRITFLTTTLVSNNSALEFHKINGEVVEGDDGYAEFITDEKALYELILKVFYTPV